MTRRTSVETYHRIEAEGLLSRLRMECYALLYEYGPMTAGELMEKARGINPNWSDRHVWSLEKRLSELARLGTAAETCRRSCRISGRLCIEWDVTGNVPSGSLRESPTKEIVKALKEEVGNLKHQIAELRAMIEPKNGSQGYFFK